MTIEKFRTLFAESIAVKQRLLTGDHLAPLAVMGERIAQAVQRGNKVMLCGNGGSAADAQHLAAELLIRLRPDRNRKPVPALALAQDTSTLTACGNDFGYDQIFSRVLSAIGKPGDILLGISTSGNSVNVINAFKVARASQIATFAFLGGNGGELLPFSDEAFLVPSSDTGRIQEAHITAGHALMEDVEDRLLAAGYLVV